MPDVTEMLASLESEHSSAPEPKEVAKPDLPDTDAPAETPEVAEQEAETEVADKPENDAEKDRKKAHALEQRLKRETAKKYELRGENQALRERVEQFEQAIRAQQQPQGEQRALTQEDIHRQARNLVAQERLNASLDDFVEKGRTTNKAFDEHVKTVHEEVPLMDDKGRPTPLMSILRECDAPFKVLAFLAENPEEAAQLADLSPARVARKLAQIDIDLAKPIKQVSSAPAPIKPLGGGGRTGKSVDDMHPDELLAIVRGKP